MLGLLKQRKEERKTTSRAGHLALTARAAALDGAGRTTRHKPRQTGVFCWPPGLVALVRTVGRPHRSAVKVGRKLEKRALAQASTTDAPEQLRACLTVVGRPATAARSQSAKPGTGGALPLNDSPAISPGLSRPLGLGWLAARPVRRCPSRHSRQARHRMRLTSTGTDRSGSSSLPCPSDVISAHPLATSCSYSPRRLAHVPCSSRCR